MFSLLSSSLAIEPLSSGGSASGDSVEDIPSWPPDFKEAVFKWFQLGSHYFHKQVSALNPQQCKSYMEYGAKLKEAWGMWLTEAKVTDMQGLT